MASGKLLLVLIILLCAFSSTPFVSCGNNFTNDIEYSEFLKVPPSEFAGSLRVTIDVVQQLASNLSPFANVTFGDFRLSNAISDCLDLLGFTADELDLSLSASQNQSSKDNGTGNLSSDLRTWLSAALVNQDTCSEGLDGSTKNIVIKKLVSIGLNEITSLVQDLLAKVHPDPVSNHYDEDPNGQIPSWVRNEDQNLLLQADDQVAVDAIVAQDGTGNFTSVQEAVLAAPDHSPHRHVIYIKRGVYKEYVEVKSRKWNLMMIGAGMDATIISGNRSHEGNWTTFRSATFVVSSTRFIAQDIMFENTAGPKMGQAVALRSDADLSVFYQCGFQGYQDTLYIHSKRQFFRECKISGTVDFIFGDATVVFQNCEIRARQGQPKQKNTITAQGRKYPNEPMGFSIQFCNITADSDLLAASVNSTPTYLGRPWKPYSRTVIMQSFLSDVIRPEGWLEWNGSYALDSLFYGEYKNYGPGAGLESRVKWPGYHVFNDSTEAKNYTVAEFIKGDLWLPSAGVQYTAGLVV